MLSATIVTLIVTAAIGYALRSGRKNGLIARRPYNNRYNDASSARDGRLRGALGDRGLG